MNDFNEINEPNEIIEAKKKKKFIIFYIRKNLKLIIPLLIIIIGTCIMIFPWYKAWKFNNVQGQALKKWRESIVSGELTPNGTIRVSSNGNWFVSTVMIGDFINEDGVWEENTNPVFSLDYLLNYMEGVLTIQKINLKSVILKPATKQNLDISVCSVLETRVMGQTGNYILAGHYSQIYGRHFNRIKELTIGDILTVDNGYEEFNYQVIEIFSVTPTEVWVMNNDDTRKLITLITCDYATNPYNRWIVRGEIIN